MLYIQMVRLISVYIKGYKILAKFIASCVIERLAVQAVGKNSIKELDRTDLVAVEKDLAQFAGVRYAGSHRDDKQSTVG